MSHPNTLICSRQNGAPRKFYFFLLPSYWCGGCIKKSSRKDDSSADAVGIAVNDVRKQYGDFEALKGVSMRMERGEVTAILGHNGAGAFLLCTIIAIKNCRSSRVFFLRE